MRAICITISEHNDAGETTRHATRWAHTDTKGHWSSATAGGKEHREHLSEAAARQALAGWLRSQAMILQPDDTVIDTGPATHERGSIPQADASVEAAGMPGGACEPDPWEIPGAPSAAGLEDLL